MSASPSLIGATVDGPAIVGQHSEDAAALYEYLLQQSAETPPGPPWHYCPLPTPGLPTRVRDSVCGVRVDRASGPGTSRGVSAPHLVTCPDCLLVEAKP